MRIIHIVQCAGGVDKYLTMLLPLFKGLKIHQVLICSYDYNKESYNNIVDEIEQIEMGQSLNPFIIIKTVCKLRKLIIKYNPDIIYCHSSMAGGMGRLAAIGLSKKVIYNPHGWAFNME